MKVVMVSLVVVVVLSTIYLLTEQPSEESNVGIHIEEVEPKLASPQENSSSEKITDENISTVDKNIELKEEIEDVASEDSLANVDSTQPLELDRSSLSDISSLNRYMMTTSQTGNLAFNLKNIDSLNLDDISQVQDILSTQGSRQARDRSSNLRQLLSNTAGETGLDLERLECSDSICVLTGTLEENISVRSYVENLIQIEDFKASLTFQKMIDNGNGDRILVQYLSSSATSAKQLW